MQVERLVVCEHAGVRQGRRSGLAWRSVGGWDSPMSCSTAFSRAANAARISSCDSELPAVASSACSCALSGLFLRAERKGQSQNRAYPARHGFEVDGVRLDHQLRPRLRPRRELRRRKRDLTFMEIADLNLQRGQEA